MPYREIFDFAGKIGEAFYLLHVNGATYNNINAVRALDPKETAVFCDFSHALKVGGERNFTANEIDNLSNEPYPLLANNPNNLNFEERLDRRDRYAWNAGDCEQHSR